MKYIALLSMAVTFCVTAEEDVQDMTDPLAVYTQVGMGVTDKGLNLKVGQAYDTGNPDTAAMNIVEIKGFFGQHTGWDEQRDDSVDSLRFRNFSADLTNGRGSQIDVQYDLNSESGSASYSLIQGLPKMGPVSLFPLAGAGVAFQNGMDENGVKNQGYEIPGTFAVVGTYGKLALSDKLSMNYNPMWFTTLSGSEEYVESAMENDNSVLRHEVALSYQFNPRFNMRYFSNWSQNQSFTDGEHRIEFNYQL